MAKGGNMKYLDEKTDLRIQELRKKLGLRFDVEVIRLAIDLLESTSENEAEKYLNKETRRR